jgi:8-oxo-dGTP diphosphatase
MPGDQSTKVGVGVMIFKDGKILLGKRKNSHGSGEYAFPGGHLEYMESFEGCAKRETLEETGMEIDNVRFSVLSNFKQYAPKHYVHISLTAEWKSGEPKLLEPEKVESWDWYAIDNLPTPLFGTTPITIEAYKSGKNYFDA